METHSINQLRTADSNPVGTAKDNTKEPINMVVFFCVIPIFAQNKDALLLRSADP